MTEEGVEPGPEAAGLAPSEKTRIMMGQPPAGSRSRAYKLGRPRESRIRKWLSRLSVKRPAWVKMDVLCMTAAVLGLVSLALPWVSELDYGGPEYRTLWHYVADGAGEGVEVFGLVAGFILVGSLLALFTRLGGLVQMAGLVSFLTILLPSTDGISIGFPVALVGCIAGVLSMALRRPYPLPQRLWTLNLTGSRDRLEINLISILGGTIGLMCIVLPWFETVWRPNYYTGFEDTNLYTLYQFSGGYVSSITSWTAGVMFIAGSTLALFSPLGAVGQIAGWGLFLYDLRLNTGSFQYYFAHYYSYTESAFSFGFYLGLACGLMVLASMFVRWRLRLSRRAVSWFIPWPVGMSGPPSEAAVSEPKAPEAFSFAKVLRSSLKALVVTIVVLAVIVASAGLAYIVPWSTLDVSVWSNYPDQRLHIAIYIDGEGMVVDYVNEGTSLEKSFPVHAGIHRVAFDYGVVGDETGSQVDGILEWATSVQVKPLRSAEVAVSLGFPYHERPVVDLSSSPYGNGEMVNITRVNDDLYSGLYWNDLRIMLRDGANTAQWSPWSSDLDNGTYTEHTFSPVLLGQLSVTCKIVDLMGNGFVNADDYLIFTTDSDYMFSSSVTYTLYLLDEPSGSLAGELEFQGRY